MRKERKRGEDTNLVPADFDSTVRLVFHIETNHVNRVLLPHSIVERDHLQQHMIDVSIVTDIAIATLQHSNTTSPKK